MTSDINKSFLKEDTSQIENHTTKTVHPKLQINTNIGKGKNEILTREEQLVSVLI